jgi:hypothetical protein
MRFSERPAIAEDETLGRAGIEAGSTTTQQINEKLRQRNIRQGNHAWLYCSNQYQSQELHAVPRAWDEDDRFIVATRDIRSFGGHTGGLSISRPFNHCFLFARAFPGLMNHKLKQHSMGIARLGYRGCSGGRMYWMTPKC